MNLCPELRRLSAEHARWIAAVERWAREDGEDRAERLLALWEGEVLPHCRGEEDVLLPELARRIPEADAVIVFTLGDHVALRRLARELREAREPDRPAAASSFRRKLEEHLAFEEKTLFPSLQETIGCDRIAALAAEMTMSEPVRRVAGPPAAHMTRTGKKP